MMNFLEKKRSMQSRVGLFFIPLLAVGLYIGGGAVCIRVLDMDPVFSTILMDIVFGVLCAAYVYRFAPCVTGDGRSVTGVRMKYMMWVMLVAVWIFGQITSSHILEVTGDASFKAYQSTLGYNTTLFMSVLLTVVAAPFCEEMMLRGLVQDMWSRVNPWLGLFGSALLFSMLHGTLVHLPSTFLMGLMTSVVYASTGNIWYSVLIHVGYNGAVSFLGKFALPGFFFEPVVFITADVLLVVWMVIEYRRAVTCKKEAFHGEEEKAVDVVDSEEAHD